MYKTDREGYRGEDSGCVPATMFSGERSQCLECPFLECVWDRKDRVTHDKEKRAELIRQMNKEGISEQALMYLFETGESRIEKILNNGGDANANRNLLASE